MTGRSRRPLDRTTRRRLLGAPVALLALGSLTGGCSRDDLEPAPDVVSAGPQLFVNGVGVTVTRGAAGPDVTPDGPLWWFTVPDGVLAVYNGTTSQAVVRVAATAVVACSSATRLVVDMPNGRSRSLDASQSAPGALRVAVRIQAGGSVNVAVHIDGPPCRAPNDPRDLYAGLRDLRAVAAGSRS